MIDKILKQIESKESWINDNEFLIDVIFSASFKLLNKCHKEMEGDNLIAIIPPLLRQVQENIVVILGLLANSYSIEEFAEKGHQPKQIMSDIKKPDKNIDEETFNKLNVFLIGLKKLLNIYSHTSFDGVMFLFTERFQSFESSQFNKFSILFIMQFLEAPLIALYNKYYDQSFDLPDSQIIVNRLKEIKTLKYATKNMPTSIKEFINQSKYLSSYYVNIRDKFMNEIKNIKEIKKD